MKKKRTHTTTKNTQKKQVNKVVDDLVKMIDNFKCNFDDILHPDGSKTYQTVSEDYITIQNPEFVALIEDILTKDYRGWSYVPIIEDFVNKGKDIYNEKNNVFRILD